MASVEVPGPSTELNSELRDLGSRDLQLWSIGALVLTVVALGFLALVVPNLMWKDEPFKVEARFLPQLFTGFVVLIVLFNVYLLDQKRRINSMRDNLVRRMMVDGATDKAASRDRLTDTFNREYAASVIVREMERGVPYTLVMVDIADFRRINKRFGQLAGDHLLLVASQLLRRTFRGSDVVCRYGGDEFLVILPETSQQLAQAPLARLDAAVHAWNETANLSYSLAFRVAAAAGPAEGSASVVVEDMLARTRGDREFPSTLRLPAMSAQA